MGFVVCAIDIHTALLQQCLEDAYIFAQMAMER